MSKLVDALMEAKNKGRLKKKKVSLGSKGSFTISHPGWTRNQAAKSGMSTREWAEEHSSDAGVAGRRARSALGLMGMKH